MSRKYDNLLVGGVVVRFALQVYVSTILARINHSITLVRTPSQWKDHQTSNNNNQLHTYVRTQ